MSQGTTFDELAAPLRQIDGQRDKGKHPPNLHFRSKPFPHIRNGPDRTYADVQFGEAPVGLALVRDGTRIVIADSDRFDVPGASQALQW